MLGTTVTRKVDKVAFTVAAYDEAQGAFTLAPVEFGASIAVAAGRLRSEFSGVRNVEPPGTTDEVSGWKRIGANFERAMRRQRITTDGLLTPEDVLSGRARARAEQIAADPDAMAEYAVGLLPVSKEVAAVLDEVVAEQEADADRKRPRSTATDGDDDTITTTDARGRLGHR